MTSDAYDLAADALGVLRARGATLAVAESLTGGALGAAITAVPGASTVFVGGVVAYATSMKHSLLGVDAGLLQARGAVDPDVAAGMAEGCRVRTGATYAAALTGAAGPDPQDGQPPGTVFVAVAGPTGTTVGHLELDGDRSAVREQAVAAALKLVIEVAREGAKD